MNDFIKIADKFVKPVAKVFGVLLALIVTCIHTEKRINVIIKIMLSSSYLIN